MQAISGSYVVLRLSSDVVVGGGVSNEGGVEVVERVPTISMCLNLGILGMDR